MKIKSIEVTSFSYPTRGRFKFFEGPDGQSTGRPSVLVKVTSDDGTVGWGQSVPIPKWSYETPESVVSTVQLYLAPQLINRDPFDIEAIHRVMNSCIAGSFSTGMPMAKAGIDLALHDLTGRVQGRNIAEVWGRASSKEIELSWTLNPRNIDEVESLIDEGWRKGYRHFNVKVAPDLEFDLELCKRVRRKVPDGFLWADANCGYDLETALDAARSFADVGVDVLEQPLRPNQLTGYRELKRQGALPIIMDEGVVSPDDLQEFIRLGLLDGLAMKPARCGGLVSAKRQMEICEEEGLILLGSGLTDPDVSLAASLILYGSFGYSRPAALNGPQFLQGSVLKRPFDSEGGSLSVPLGPGLGVQVDEARLRSEMESSA